MSCLSTLNEANKKGYQKRRIISTATYLLLESRSRICVPSEVDPDPR